MKWFNSLSVVLVISFTLTACGGGDGGGGGPRLRRPASLLTALCKGLLIAARLPDSPV